MPFGRFPRIVPDVSTNAGMSVELELERSVHKCFDDFGGSLICPYDISRMDSSRKRQWMEELQSNHHFIIYAPRFGEGGVITAQQSKRNE